MWGKLVKYALVVCLLLGGGFESLAASPPTTDQVEEIGNRLPVEVNAPVFWKFCGTWNGYYYPGLSIIYLCYENLHTGLEIARFIYLHELGHAYTFSRGFSYERWKGNYEAAADEFAAVISIVQGRAEDLLFMADEFERWGEKIKHREGDPHPPMLLRAWTLRRIYLGFKYPWSPYFKDYSQALRHWRDQILWKS